ncbi:unnamed protein product [Brassica oleracea var. botrytis]
MDWLCEDMWWKMMVSNDYQSQYEGFLWRWIEIATKHVISGSVWNGQQCNRWIVPRCWITMDDNQTQDHIRPRTTVSCNRVRKHRAITFISSCSA